MLIKYVTLTATPVLMEVFSIYVPTVQKLFTCILSFISSAVPGDNYCGPLPYS